MSDASVPPDGATSGCSTGAGCDDGFNCTIDTCNAGACTHAIGPNSGATACPAGQFCVSGKGCVKGKACAADADCADSDPCTTNEKCDPASSVCTYAILDKDKDGHAPQVCGGDDCDDSDPRRFPGAPELCDGKDDNCDGVVDNGAVCASPLATCQAGACQCPPANTCGSICTDKQTDTLNCGDCGHACTGALGGTPQICMAGVCACPSKAPTLCPGPAGSYCTDVQADFNNCGTCGSSCPVNAHCALGKCTCIAGHSMCADGQCYDTLNDAQNCGTCGHVCATGMGCDAGTCTCAPPTTNCGGACIDTSSNDRNCGACGKACSGSFFCVKGACSCDYGTPDNRSCGGTTVNVFCDDANCGICGNVCPTGKHCGLGRCG